MECPEAPARNCGEPLPSVIMLGLPLKWTISYLARALVYHEFRSRSFGYGEKHTLTGLESRSEHQEQAGSTTCCTRKRGDISWSRLGV